MSGPSLRRRKSIIMLSQIGSFTSSGRENVIDSAYLPEWMYHHPEYIHQRPLDIKVEEQLDQVESMQGLRTAPAKWRTQKMFSRFQ